MAGRHDAGRGRTASGRCPSRRRAPARRPGAEDALAHLAGGLVGERDGEDLPRPHAPRHEVGDAMREHARLAQPAPARISSGPSVVVTARACSGLSRETISAQAHPTRSLASRPALATWRRSRDRRWRRGGRTRRRLPRRAVARRRSASDPGSAERRRPRLGRRLSRGSRDSWTGSSGAADVPNRRTSRSHPGTDLTPSNSTGRALTSPLSASQLRGKRKSPGRLLGPGLLVREVSG